MAKIGDLALTLTDLGKRLDANGKIDKIIEIAAETNEVVLDMLNVEGNLATGHKTTIRTGYPSAFWRMYNQGVPQSKSKTQQITDTCGMLEAFSTVDADMADLNGNTAEFRLSEDRAYIQAMNMEMAKTVFYGDTSKTPEKFLGLAPRYSTLDPKVPISKNVIDAGGANNLTSIFLVCWGANTVHGIYPKGSKAGFSHEDLGRDKVTDGNGGTFMAYQTHYKWDLGLCVRDHRYVVRIANIDLATITDEKFIEFMIRASELLPDENLGRPVFYMNRAARTRLRLAKLGNKNTHVTFDTVEGKKVMKFDEIPVRRTDALTEDETKVAA
ncbi:MAG: hypothetical protein LBV79_06800 [Candidatus Adiutrix sp.]|jgi:hypothetical protein|nr:hypothetical protein [Candidatus Adiutrix sp.]